MAGGYTDVDHPQPNTPNAPVARDAATPTCMSLSTITPGSPMSKPEMMKKAKLLLSFGVTPRDWFNNLNVAVDAVMTDNGPNFTSDVFAAALAENRTVHLRTRPYRPQTNGKTERFNRTLAEEFLYNYQFRSEPDRRRRLQNWIHTYNLHRHHTAINNTPASRVNNLTGHYN